MTDRVMPAPDSYATCPLDGRILDFYAGTFDAAYISLNPFIRPVSISPSIFCPATYPDRQTLVSNCEAVTWAEVMSLSGLPSISAVDIGLKTQIGALAKKFANAEYGDSIEKLFDSASIVPPPEGEHPDLLHNHVLEMFQELGHSWVWVGDEFCLERKLYWIEDLKSESKRTVRGHSNVFAPDKSLLWTVHWDSHFTFLCSSKNVLDRIGVSTRLEGFFCKPDTEVYWSVHEP